MNKYHIPKNTYPIDSLYVALSIDDYGNEGIVSAIIEGNSHPFVFGNKSILDKVMPMIREMSKETKQKIQIFKFDKKELLDVIG